MGLNSCVLLPVNSWVTLDKLLNFSNSQFPHQSNGVITGCTLYRASWRVKWGHQCQVLCVMCQNASNPLSSSEKETPPFKNRLCMRCLVLMSWFAYLLFTELCNMIGFLAVCCVFRVVLTEEFHPQSTNLRFNSISVIKNIKWARMHFQNCTISWRNDTVIISSFHMKNVNSETMGKGNKILMEIS